MAYSSTKNVLKTFCLKRKLKWLEAKRNSEIEKFIAYHPSQASRMDNLDKSINSEEFQAVNIKIKAIQRLLEKHTKN
jgi:hypothetical protein